MSLTADGDARGGDEDVSHWPVGRQWFVLLPGAGGVALEAGTRTGGSSTGRRAAFRARWFHAGVFFTGGTLRFDFRSFFLQTRSAGYKRKRPQGSALAFVAGAPSESHRRRRRERRGARDRGLRVRLRSRPPSRRDAGLCKTQVRRWVASETEMCLLRAKKSLFHALFPGRLKIHPCGCWSPHGSSAPD